MKAPVICIVHMVPTRDNGICPYCQNKFWYEQVRLVNQIAQAERIASKLVETELDYWTRRD